MNVMSNKIKSLGLCLALIGAGCQSGMYSTSISVDGRDGGIRNYKEVSSLESVKEYGTMPVEVKWDSKHTKENCEGLNSLWLLSLGIFPYMSEESVTYEAVVKTPLGTKTGECSVEAKYWMGWLPMFLPYPGSAETRTANPKLPNSALEKKVKDQLVANLVSEYSSEEYQKFCKKDLPRVEYEQWKRSDDGQANVTQDEFYSKFHKGWRERAESKKTLRLAKEAKAKELENLREKRAEYIKGVVEADLKAIDHARREGRGRYENPFHKDWDWNDEWLSVWTGPRRKMPESQKLAGEALISEFGTKYMPLAYSNYEKKKTAAFELQQVFNEEYPKPWSIKYSDAKWSSYQKVLEKFAEVRAEYFLCHDELCYYWLLWRFNLISAEDLAAIDAPIVAAPLLPEDVENIIGVRLEDPVWLESKYAEFAGKYAPESMRIYQKFEKELKELDRFLREVSVQRFQLDQVRFSRVIIAAYCKHNAIVRALNSLVKDIKEWYSEHRTTVKSAEDVAGDDRWAREKLMPFVNSLRDYIKERALGPIIPEADMIKIPGRNYKVQRFEVTQLQWMLVMGKSPMKLENILEPVWGISYKECQAFVTKLNTMDGTNYRLPTVEEWTYACRAGAKKGICRFGYDSEVVSDERSNGSVENLERVAWPSGVMSPCEVGMKEPNAYGLYDMLGNVWEMTTSKIWVDQYGGAYDDNGQRFSNNGQGFLRGAICGGGFDSMGRINYGKATLMPLFALKDDEEKIRIPSRKAVGFRVVK